MRKLTAAVIAAGLMIPLAVPLTAQAYGPPPPVFHGHDVRGGDWRGRDWREHEWREREWHDHRAYYAPPGAYYGPRRYTPPPLFGITIR